MLRHQEFESLCKQVSAGAKRRVRHIVTHQEGRIIACRADDFMEVELRGGEHKTWSKDNVTLLH